MKGVFLVFAVLLYSTFSTAQDLKEPAYPEFSEYKKWGYHLGFMTYDATKNVNPTGPYVLDHEAQNGFSVGFTKLLRAEYAISYKVGIYYQSTPVYKTSLLFDSDDTFFQPPLRNDYRVSRFNFHVPLLIQFKKQLDTRIYFNIESGLMFALIPPGSADSTSIRFVTSLEDKREVFGIRAENITQSWILPNLIISPGLYYMTEPALYQLNFIYQNSLIRYYEGQYVVDNLAVSERSESDTTLSGDYIGISFNIHLRKKRK
ncbi:hypothetical protein LX97_00618 [Nonlabens dokdonensis]|jgi:hypothetical protein|uniref:Outer membrane protein beta-barrel domain-containing protein n=2 Tax=Nonlabens dokdonensis TaxID=328515 RepID=L7W737_NONDD|nr:hypothetical protein [Nonlabens dokdonensis]AGC75939.1 hypothetical protein DDD_0812 [Nonlabens dokdonensis DSW-6]PZX43617.1 hypothetical protein LX97_00618 [Nonlabens dokdonensis]